MKRRERGRQKDIHMHNYTHIDKPDRQTDDDDDDDDHNNNNNNKRGRPTDNTIRDRQHYS